MDIQRPIFWHQGLFLQPQHFQLLDLSFRSLLAPYFNFLEPHFWGISEIKIQEAALGNRTFNTIKGNFLFQQKLQIYIRLVRKVKSKGFIMCLKYFGKQNVSNWVIIFLCLLPNWRGW